MHSSPAALRFGAFAALLTLPLLLTGCLSVHIRQVNKTVVAPHVLDSTLDQLVTRMNGQFGAVQSLNASIEIAASTGGEHEGQIKEIPTFSGYIFLRKPDDLRVLLLLPVIRSRALDMVSDGKTFKLLVPPKNRAITGADEIVDPVAFPAQVGSGTAANGLQSRNSGLESLRPNIIREALLVPPLAADEFITRTEHSRILAPVAGRKERMEEPDYDLTILRQRTGQTAETVRVIHIGRIDLRPYQQDIYDHAGRVVTTVMYSKFGTFNGVEFPQNILIQRPIDEYTLNIEITKLQLNVKFDDEQFQLKIPENIPVQKM